MDIDQIELADESFKTAGPNAHFLRHLREHHAEVQRLRAEGIDPDEEWRQFVSDNFDPDALRTVIEAYLSGEDDDADDVDEPVR